MVASLGLLSMGARVSAAAAHRLSLFHGMWGPSGLGIEPMSPALTDGFFTTEPLGKPLNDNYSVSWLSSKY